MYEISYDLNRPGKDYPDLYAAIKNLGSWCHPVDSTWFIVTDLSANTIANKLKLVMDKSDALIVVQVSGQAAWFGLSDEVNAWLKKHL